MTSQEVAITISTNTTQAQESVKSFKAQLREANGELVAMSEKFGSASAEAVAAAKKVAGLKDAIGDAKALAETFNPDKKFVALGGAIQGAVSGFSALQGATALFGEEGKDLEKTLLKVQSVMALQQGISGVFGAIDSFKLLGNTIKTNVVSAFSSMKSAIISTGLGILVVAIGAVAEAFSSMADRAEEAAEATKKANEQAIKYTNEGLKAEQEFLKQKEKLDIAKAKSAGKSEEEIFNLQQNYRGQNIRSLQRAYNEAKGVDEVRASEIKKQIDAINNDGQVAELENQTRLNKIKEEGAKQAAAKRKEAADKEKADLKAQQDALKNIINKTQIDIENLSDTTEAQKLERQRKRDIEELDAVKLSAREKRDAIDLINKKYDILNTELEAENKKKKEKEEAEKEEQKQKDLAKKAEEQAAADKKRIDDNKKTEDQIVKDKQAAAQAKLEIDNSTIQAGQQLFTLIAGLDQKNKGLQKAALIGQSALSIASIIANTNVGSSKEVATKGIFGLSTSAILYAKMGLSIASVIAATAKGLSQLGGGSAGGVGGAGAAASAPSAPIPPQASSTTLNQGQVNQIGNVAARAFVVESDVSGQQERIRRLNRAARIN